MDDHGCRMYDSMLSLWNISVKKIRVSIEHIHWKTQPTKAMDSGTIWYYCIVSKLSCHANFTHEQFKSPNQKPYKNIIIKHEDLSHPWRLTGLPLQIVASAASGRRWVPPTDSTAACHARQERIRCRTGDGPSGWPREDAHRLRQEKTTVTPILWSWR